MSNMYKILLFQKYEGMLVTCNMEDLFYPMPVNYKEKISKKILFDSYKCHNGKLRLRFGHYKSRHIRCFRGCESPARDDSIHVFSNPENCKNLSSDIGETTITAYHSCDIRCQPGYYAESSGEKQVISQEVFCSMNFQTSSSGDYLPSYWSINKGNTNETFVKCLEGCFLYGSYYEEIYGMILNFKTIGTIDEVPRYESGEIYCDKVNGYFPVAEGYKENFIVNCRLGEHWEPVNPSLYCIKGCRKPGGKHGQDALPGYKFACSDGFNGWYPACTFACDVSSGYVRVDSAYKELPMPNAEKIQCDEGLFPIDRAKSKCIKACSIAAPCDLGYGCIGKISSETGSDSGKRYCKG